MSGGNDERENTLNALLVEMDGFEKEQGRARGPVAGTWLPDADPTGMARVSGGNMEEIWVHILPHLYVITPLLLPASL